MQFRPLRADEIECRVSTVKQNGCSLLLYKDSRADMNLLDETVGMENWQRKHELIDGQLFCSIGIRVKHDDGTTEWIWKQDVGVESYTEKEKGRASDSFKRAAFNIGCGRELYTAPFIWIGSDMCKIQQKGQGYTTYDKFEVAEIGYDENRRINHLVITNNGKKVYELGKKPVRKSDSPKKEEPKPEEHVPANPTDKINKIKVMSLMSRAKADGVPEEVIFELCHVKSWQDITEEYHSKLNSTWEKVVAYGNKRKAG